MNLRQTLYAWRDAEATKRGVDLFRILPNSALDEIVKALPRTKEELTSIKGIKDAKYQHYGKLILAMVDESLGKAGNEAMPSSPKPDETPSDDIISVSTYLDIVNSQLARVTARVRGEIIQFKVQGSALYATMKDTKDESVLSVFMWTADYRLSGVELVEGMEVVVEGRSEVYKPSGRMSFRAETIELVGEGALKKAYDELKKKLDGEGVFAPERKKALPDFPEKIGLITSKQGAVIHDFLNNLGKFGYRVEFVNSRVEGAGAVKDLLASIAHFKNKDIDTLVIIRGGGSLESLQAFNNELVVRAIADFPKPTIVAIGHDKDVPLSQLVADNAPSTPTAVTILLNHSWEEGMHTMRTFSRDIVNLFNEELWLKKDELRTFGETLSGALALIGDQFAKVANRFSSSLTGMQKMQNRVSESLNGAENVIVAGYGQTLRDIAQEFNEITRGLRSRNPLELLKLGYSILSKNGKILRSVRDLPPGTHFDARLSDGTISAVTE